VKRLLCVLAALVLLTAPATAHADGDPASDVLLQDDVFFPYAPRTAPRLSEALTRLLARTRREGYPMKVALIESPNDLGVNSNLFYEPGAYGNLLSSELRTMRHGHVTETLHLLVVMPSGFSGTGLGDGVDAALAPVKIDTAAQSDGLARAAIEAVARIATSNGHPTPVPAVAKLPLAHRHESTARSGTSPLPFLLPIVVIAGGLVAAGWLTRRRSRDPAQ
jgi:hypothetical protein